ncbi:MAG: Crp/Fnr family transcriptional regulator, partial [Candidatus Adiutrix sp.]
ESMPHYLLNPDEMVFENGDILIKEGNTDTSFYKLIQGSLAVYKGQTQIAEISQNNTFFGEMSALMGGTRSATIKSQGKSIVKVFPGDKLMEVLEGYPDIAKNMITTLVDRLSATNVRLSEYMMDRMELERTYLNQLTSTTGAAGTPRPIASAPRRSATLTSAVAGSRIPPEDVAINSEPPKPTGGGFSISGTVASSPPPRLTTVLAEAAQTAMPLPEGTPYLTSLPGSEEIGGAQLLNIPDGAIMVASKSLPLADRDLPIQIMAHSAPTARALRTAA